MTTAPARFSVAMCGAEHRGFVVHRLDFDRHTRGPCVHECATLLFATAGDGEWRAGRDRVQQRAGEIALLSAGESHVYADCDRIEGWVLHVSKAALADAHGSTALFDPLDRVRRGVPRMAASAARIDERFARIDDELTHRRWCFEEAAHAELTLLLTDLGRALPASDRPSVPALPGRVGEALAWIEARYRDAISLEDVARALRCNAAHLTTIVRRETGMTVQQWILAFRMAEARRRLERTDEQVEIIGERVGFRSPEHFARTFKREHGVAPGRWRQSRIAPTAEQRVH